MVRALEPGSQEAAGLMAFTRARFGVAAVDVVRGFGRILILRSPDADNFVLVGAQVPSPLANALPDGVASASVGGTGATIEQAFTACVGEAIELLAGFERPGDIAAHGTAAGVHPPPGERLAAWAMAHLPPDRPRDAMIDWVAGLDAQTGATCLLPADLCLRRSPEARVLVPRTPLSIGCAAGETREDARRRAVLELVERDAASLWWAGGRRGRPLATHEAEAATLYTGALRGSASARRTWLLDLTTDLGVPVVAAISVAGDGRGMACGLAARPLRPDAIEAAIREMMQVELAYAIVAAKLRSGGMAALAAAERRHLARATQIEEGICSLIHPTGEALSAATGTEKSAMMLNGILGSLSENNIDVAFLDWSRADLGSPVARAVAPQLQTDPAGVRTQRLADAIRTHGGGAEQTRGVELF